MSETATVDEHAEVLALRQKVNELEILKPRNRYNYKLLEKAIIRDFLSLWLEKLFYFTMNFINEIQA